MSTGMQVAKAAALVLVAGLLGMGCIPLNVPYTISLGETDLYFSRDPGDEIDSSIPAESFQIPCDQFSANTIQETIRKYAGDFVASLVHLEEIRLINMEMTRLAPADGTFVGLTKVALMMNGGELLSATADTGITAGKVLLAPKNTLNILELLDDCPIPLALQMAGYVPQVPPTRSISVLNIEILGRIGF